MRRQAAALPTLAQVNRRHVNLLVDFMCFSGKVEGATAAGLGQQTANVWSRACFSGAMQHLVDAAVHRRRLVNGRENVASCVVTGQTVSLGSGYTGFELLPDEAVVAEEPPAAEEQSSGWNWGALFDGLL